jgi:hypothetical protein
MYGILKCSEGSDKVFRDCSVSDDGEEIYSHKISGYRIA